MLISIENTYNISIKRMKNTPNISLNHLIIPCKPPAFSNTTTHHRTNFQHHKYRVYKYLNQIKYYSSHLINNTHSHLQEMKNTPNMYLNHLNTMQTTRLLQHNIPPQIQFPTSQV